MRKNLGKDALPRLVGKTSKDSETYSIRKHVRKLVVRSMLKQTTASCASSHEKRSTIPGSPVQQHMLPLRKFLSLKLSDSSRVIKLSASSEWGPGQEQTLQKV